MSTTTTAAAPGPRAPGAFVKPATVGALAAEFLACLGRRVPEGRCAARTVAYYRSGVGRWVEAVGAGLPLAEVIPFLVERHCRNWHATQAVKRLFAWAADMGLVERSPVASVALPPRGQRERVLSPAERARLLRGAGRAFRDFMLAMLETLARPQEVRALRWDQLRDGAFALGEFKGKGRRRDGLRLRLIPVSARLARLLGRLARRPGFDPAGPVLLNDDGRPWTANAVRCRMRRLRRRAGLDGGGERVVAYTLRHTAATLATANGVGDRLLAELMGHASTRTTARYQHLQAGHLKAAIDRATRRPA